ncbi:hypothetical protein BOTBODRAFT_365219 [Botryobasidium botryosum FD-172 SS1]|uniref:Zn(2)-C6 fungal-type domain-containing protein n=1 Tax=Botryobasidium botryosum (strain FD-172 SS1) TaxID=930990 RepID=A0A067MP75_BOTB1|nr:hypothetical protein BOTBODRAFT_365219 [Botryobasidium botryosum FD-172 SS1]
MDMLTILNRGRACLACRTKKRRCDGVRPICTPCMQSKRGHLCVFDAAPARDAPNMKRRIKELDGLVKNAKDAAGPSKSQEPTPISKLVSVSKPQPRPPLPMNAAAPTAVALGDPQIEWWKDGSAVPLSIRDSLIDLCMRYSWHFSWHLNFRMLKARFELPQDHPDAPHPALLYAVLLVGCIYTPSPLQCYEPIFLQRARRHLSQLLGTGTKMFDFLCASTLVGSHLYGKGRMREGHYHISAAARFAVGCGLHQIGSLSLDAQVPSALLFPCLELAELGDRITIFWELVCFDRVGSIFLDVPATIADKEVTTLWPCPSTYYEDGRAYTQTTGSIQMLNDPKRLRLARGDSFVALRQKAVILLARTTSLSARVKSGDPEDTALMGEISLNCQCTQAFVESLPAFHVQEGEAEDLDAARALLSVAFVSAYSAVIQAYGMAPKIDYAARDVQSDAAKRAIVIVKEIDLMPRCYVPLLIGWSLLPVHEVLVRQHVRATALGQEDARAIQGDIQLVLRVVERIGELFPAIATATADIMTQNTEAVKVEHAKGST